MKTSEVSYQLTFGVFLFKDPYVTLCLSPFAEIKWSSFFWPLGTSQRVDLHLGQIFTLPLRGTQWWPHL